MYYVKTPTNRDASREAGLPYSCGSDDNDLIESPLGQYIGNGFIDDNADVNWASASIMPFAITIDQSFGCNSDGCTPISSSFSDSLFLLSYPCHREPS